MKVLMATDGSKFSRAAIEKGCEIIGGGENISVKVISAVATPYVAASEPFAVSADYYRDLEGELRKEAKKNVEEAEAKIRASLPNADVTTQVFVGSPDQTIVEEAQNWGADLIVVGSHGYGFWSRALLGSVSNSVLNHAPCSVLVVRGVTTEDS